LVHFARFAVVSLSNSAFDFANSLGLLVLNDMFPFSPYLISILDEAFGFSLNTVFAISY